MRKLFILILIPITSYAGYIIPDTRRDQTWSTSNIAAASYLKRNNVSVNHSQINYKLESYETRYISDKLISLSQSGAHTLELELDAYNDKITGSSSSEEYSNKVSLAYSYLINEKLSIGSYWDYSTEYDDNSYLGSVWKMDGNTYLGMRISDFFADHDRREKKYILGYGKRGESLDYELSFAYTPNISLDKDETNQSSINFLSVWRLNKFELQSSYEVSYTNIEEGTEDLSKTGHWLYLRPEYEYLSNHFLGAVYSYTKRDKTYKDSETNTDYTLDEDYQKVAFFLRSVINSFQFYASYSFSDNNRDYSHRTSNDDYLEQSFYVKLSYLY